MNFFGVAKNDQYSLADGIGAARGPNTKAEFSFSVSFPAEIFEKAIDLEDVRFLLGVLPVFAGLT